MKIFTNLGYTIDDAEFLNKEFQRQALEKYINGDYELDLLDCNGQRISIKVNFGGTSFYSGWMVEPKGVIRLVTPFGGW